MELKVTNDLQASENSELRSRLDEYNEHIVGKREPLILVMRSETRKVI